MSDCLQRDAQGCRKLSIDRPKVSNETEAAIRGQLAEGLGILKITKRLSVGVSTVQRIRGEAIATAR